MNIYIYMKTCREKLKDEFILVYTFWYPHIFFLIRFYPWTSIDHMYAWISTFLHQYKPILFSHERCEALLVCVYIKVSNHPGGRVVAMGGISWRTSPFRLHHTGCMIWIPATCYVCQITHSGLPHSGAEEECHRLLVTSTQPFRHARLYTPRCVHKLACGLHTALWCCKKGLWTQAQAPTGLS